MMEAKKCGLLETMRRHWGCYAGRDPRKLHFTLRCGEGRRGGQQQVWRLDHEPGAVLSPGKRWKEPDTRQGEEGPVAKEWGLFFYICVCKWIKERVDLLQVEEIVWGFLQGGKEDSRGIHSNAGIREVWVFPGGSGKESACQYRNHRRCRFDPWVVKIPWRRQWQPAPVFLPKNSHRQKNLAGYSLWGRRVWVLSLLPTQLLCPWDSPGKSTGVSSHSLHQRIFLTQGLNHHLLHFRQILHHLSHQESPFSKRGRYLMTGWGSRVKSPGLFQTKRVSSLILIYRGCINNER